MSIAPLNGHRILSWKKTEALFQPAINFSASATIKIFLLSVSYTRIVNEGEGGMGAILSPFPPLPGGRPEATWPIASGQLKSSRSFCPWTSQWLHILAGELVPVPWCSSLRLSVAPCRNCVSREDSMSPPIHTYIQASPKQVGLRTPHHTCTSVRLPFQFYSNIRKPFLPRPPSPGCWAATQAATSSAHFLFLS